MSFSLRSRFLVPCTTLHLETGTSLSSFVKSLRVQYIHSVYNSKNQQNHQPPVSRCRRPFLHNAIARNLSQQLIGCERDGECLHKVNNEHETSKSILPMPPAFVVRTRWYFATWLACVRVPVPVQHTKLELLNELAKGCLDGEVLLLIMQIEVRRTVIEAQPKKGEQRSVEVCPACNPLSFVHVCVCLWCTLGGCASTSTNQRSQQAASCVLCARLHQLA